MRFKDKVAFLSEPGAYPWPVDAVETVETHTAMVFLAGDRALKLKKPVRFGVIDFSSLERRGHFCREELRLNRQLAGHVYRDVRPLVRAPDGGLRLDGAGHVVDWLVEMTRLPADQFLDLRLAAGGVAEAEIEAVMTLLAAFYRARRAEAAEGLAEAGGPGAYCDHLLQECETNAAHLDAMAAHLGPDYRPEIAATATKLMQRHRDEIEARGRAGLIVEGHGDLRPEHVCLVSPPVIFDRLEFYPPMRRVDIYDEVNYLGLECAMMGGDWIWPRVLELLERAHGNPPSVALLDAYGAFRALTRARLSIDHLRDPKPRSPQKWPTQARRYIAVAARLLQPFLS
ncbi:hypothetical protein [Acidimangrovimonas pyrenivorans]|uniref:Aminoglycoside phosphotransferase domain-containing protein n=1 Tax=Acidimangrovimonas pyrenivorans TaxID=2030798 RepID=A0ABV7AJN3_9RHOB